ncbi:hypothetical protein DFH08DRAFT_808085 [Mycena albidolilacea]|uniref:Uncharacterized protein n=1 Tax=Mycena albidolilacea TaxID=1033008 RepID=A0AAD7A3N7_9AGAR|nr:hypothetical protein DFH08DRAFT_808085 [Mycena albidolilacea]
MDWAVETRRADEIKGGGNTVEASGASEESPERNYRGNEPCLLPVSTPPLVPFIEANQANQINTAVFVPSPTSYMTYFTTDDPGNVNDTGPRDNPTAADFEHNQPVKAVIGKSSLPKGTQIRALNREGRATARIDPPTRSDGRPPKSAEYFNVGKDCMKKGVKNDYNPPDNLPQDYDKVTKDFADKFPPRVHQQLYTTRPANEQPAVEKRVYPEGVEEEGVRNIKRPRYTESGISDILQQTRVPAASPEATTPQHRIRKPSKKLLASQQGSASAPNQQVRVVFHSRRPLPPQPTILAPQPRKWVRFKGDTETEHRTGNSTESALPSSPQSTSESPPKERVAPIILRVPPQAPREQRGPILAGIPPDTLPAFLKNAMGTDLSKYLQLFDAKGFKSFDILRALARLDNKSLCDTLRHLFTRDVESREDEGLTGLELVSLELAILKLPREQPVPAGPLTSLPGFLRNIFGINFTGHLPLFYAKGFGDPKGKDVEVLLMMAGLDVTILRGLLKNLLGRRGPSTDGLTDVELALVEFAILGLRN